MSWLALGAAGVVQLIAGVVRAGGWWHVIRQARPEWSELRYRDVALAHLGGVGWNAVLPAHGGDAVKVALVSRRLPNRRLSTLAATLVPPAAVEAAFTALLIVGLLGAGTVSVDVLADRVPARETVLIVTGVVLLLVIAVLVFRRRLMRLLANLRSGLSIMAHPRELVTKVVPWQLAGRVLRLLSFALVLTAAGVPFGLAPALALMALQGATPSAGAAATAARIAVLATILSATGAADASAGRVAAVLAAAYGVNSVMNLAVSGAVIAWELRTTSPRRIYRYTRSALRSARSRASSRKRPVREPRATPSAPS